MAAKAELFPNFTAAALAVSTAHLLKCGSPEAMRSRFQEFKGKNLLQVTDMIREFEEDSDFESSQSSHDGAASENSVAVAGRSHS